MKKLKFTTKTTIALYAMGNPHYPYRVQTLEGKIMKSIEFRDVNKF